MTLKGESTSQVVHDDQVKGPLTVGRMRGNSNSDFSELKWWVTSLLSAQVGSTVEVKTNEGVSSEAVIVKLTDASLYTVGKLYISLLEEGGFISHQVQVANWCFCCLVDPVQAQVEQPNSTCLFCNCFVFLNVMCGAT